MSFFVYVYYKSTFYKHNAILEADDYLFISILLAIGFCCGVVSYKASHALRPFCDLLCAPI
jgi:hypothetical protein